MFENFLDQVRLADELGFETAWVAEAHLSCEVQKTGAQPVIPHFKGEIGLNTDILQLAHLIFAKTKRIGVGSAIRNILCNGGPIAHAEAVRTYAALREYLMKDDRRLQIGFAAGRFEFSNRPFGIVPRNAVEKAAWPVVRGKIFHEATEIFLRLIKGETISRHDVRPLTLRHSDFRGDEEWKKVADVAGETGEIPLQPFFNFERLAIVPREVSLENIGFMIGSQDPEAQVLANEFLPVGVFNLSITPPKVIEETHTRMRKHYHPSGGPWKRSMMPRTAMVFVDMTTENAKRSAAKAWENYWRAMEGTIDGKKVSDAVDNTLAGDPAELARLIRERYHPEDRLMLWFDFNNHDNESVKNSMRVFRDRVIPLLGGAPPINQAQELQE